MLLLIRSLPLCFALSLVSRMLEMAFESFQISNFSPADSMPPDPFKLRGPLFIESVILLLSAAYLEVGVRVIFIMSKCKMFPSEAFYLGFSGSASKCHFACQVLGVGYLFFTQLSSMRRFTESKL